MRRIYYTPSFLSQSQIERPRTGTMDLPRSCTSHQSSLACHSKFPATELSQGSTMVGLCQHKSGIEQLPAIFPFCLPTVPPVPSANSPLSSLPVSLSPTLFSRDPVQSGPFQMSLAVLSFISSKKSVCLIMPWAGHVVNLYRG